MMMLNSHPPRSYYAPFMIIVHVCLENLSFLSCLQAIWHVFDTNLGLRRKLVGVQTPHELKQTQNGKTRDWHVYDGFFIF